MSAVLETCNLLLKITSAQIVPQTSRRHPHPQLTPGMQPGSVIWTSQREYIFTSMRYTLIRISPYCYIYLHLMLDSSWCQYLCVFFGVIYIYIYGVCFKFHANFKQNGIFKFRFESMKSLLKSITYKLWYLMCRQCCSPNWIFPTLNIEGTVNGYFQNISTPWRSTSTTHHARLFLHHKANIVDWFCCGDDSTPDVCHAGPVFGFFTVKASRSFLFVYLVGQTVCCNLWNKTD